ncbi:hypothetical protein [Methylobacterium gossipiicola]|uniref:Uncharacterized protein n=1 Tax=Methylobacterium gossipiicola TaxID=582675 RepID=A0A1I2TLF2_9HYPH|nr:hypothetical protein [Methylobacterium gossipiicola]SFG65643.1 hypothetical protein SAMN05192565_107190 [Methylobacterium gossipiicola]
MTDLSQTIAPKSDQLNADDLIGGPRTIKVTRVTKMAEPDQPIAIGFEGDGGKPYKPGKSMRRVLVWVWGADGNAYVGRRMTLYRDDKVQFGGMAVGGIRISHMSDIAAPVTMALTEKRASRKPFTVKPLASERGPTPSKGDAGGGETRPQTARDRMFTAARAAAAKGQSALDEFVGPLPEAAYGALGDIWDELQRLVADAEASNPDDSDHSSQNEAA